MITRESIYENEPKRVLLLLRSIYLIMLLDLLGFIFIVYLKADRYVAVRALVFLGLNFLALFLTYRLKMIQNIGICVLMNLIWIGISVYVYGWNCGMQHFMFPVMVLLYLSIYELVPVKILLTAVFFAMRYSLFLYCRANAPVVELPGAAEDILQVFNSAVVFALLGIICSVFSSNIETAEKKLILYNEQLKKLAQTDPLTGLYNRRRMIQQIEEMLIKYPDRRFCIALGDIDHFKQINDTWGHNCGDHVLQIVAKRLTEKVSERDLVCRWGGEEFLIFFQDKNGDEAFEVLSQIQFLMNRNLVGWKNDDLKITMTFGLEEYDFQSDLKSLVSKVDKKMYLGKEQGRNRIIY